MAWEDVKPEAGDKLFTEDGDELRIEEITGIDNEKNVFVVRCEDGKRYEVVWDGDGWFGEVYAEDMA